MKRLIIFILLLISIPCFAKNKINMVTYFPVPYVAYAQVNATAQMDVGLTNTCHMKLGCEESQSPLVTPKVNIQSGRLDLNNGRGILGENITLGNGSGTGKLAFNNVRMQEGNIQSVNATNTVVSNLNLFKHEFPACTDYHSLGQMSWQKLKLQGANSKELYLACGEAKAGEETKDCSNPPNDEWRAVVRNCSAGGTLYGNWNENLCGYEPEEYVEVTMDCLDYEHVDPDTNNVVLLSGSCRLSRNAPTEGINLYTKTLSETSWNLWDKVSPGGSLSWNDGVDHVVNPYNERKKEFAFGSDGSQEMIKTIGDCKYHFEINSDSTDA